MTADNQNERPPAEPFAAPPMPPQGAGVAPIEASATASPPPPPSTAGYAYSAGPGAWTPPPKPGLIPLRPLSFGTLLGAPFQVLRRNPKATFGSALLIQAVSVVVITLLAGVGVGIGVARLATASSTDRDQILAGIVVVAVLSGVVVLLVSFLSSALLQAVLVTEVSREIVGEKRTFGYLWRAAWKRVWPLLGFLVLVFVAVLIVLGIAAGLVVAVAASVGVIPSVFAGFLLLCGIAVLAVWIGTKLALVPAIIVLERVGIRASVARSWRLTNGSFWKTLGVLFLLNAIISLASNVVTLPISLVGQLSLATLDPNSTSSSVPTATIILLVVVNVLTLLVSVVFGALSSVILAAAIVLIYVDLRMRREGLDVELIRFVEAGGAEGNVADPFEPQPRR